MDTTDEKLGHADAIIHENRLFFICSDQVDICEFLGSQITGYDSLVK